MKSEIRLSRRTLELRASIRKKCPRERVVITILRGRCALRLAVDGLLFFFLSLSLHLILFCRQQEERRVEIGSEGDEIPGRWTRGTRLEGLSTLFYFRSSLLDGRPLVSTLPYISGLSRRLRQQVAVKPKLFTERGNKVSALDGPRVRFDRLIIFVLGVDGKSQLHTISAERGSTFNAVGSSLKFLIKTLYKLIEKQSPIYFFQTTRSFH